MKTKRIKFFKGITEDLKVLRKSKVTTVWLFLVLLFSNYMAVHAADIITTGMGTIFDIIAALVTGFGGILALWGFLEWSIAMGSQDGTSSAHAIKRIAGGMVAALAVHVVPAIILSF